MSIARRWIIVTCVGWLLAVCASPALAALPLGDAGLRTVPGPVLLSVLNVSASDRDSHSPAIAARGDQVHVVWEEGTEILHRFLSGGAWSAVRRVAAGEQPSIVITPDGIVHVIYVNEFGGNFEVYHCRWNGSSWTLPRNVSGTTGVSTAPSLSASSDGALHAVWSDNTPGYSVIYGAKWTGAYWTNAPIPNALGGAPMVAMARDGSPCVVWQDNHWMGGPYDIFCCRLLGTTWSLPENVSDSPGEQSLAPRAASDGLGTIHVVWEERLSGTHTVRVSFGTSGSWSLPESVSAPQSQAYLPTITIGRGLNVYVGWDEATLARYRQRSANSVQWTEQTTVASATLAIRNLSLVTDSLGQLHAVWCERTDQGHLNVYYSRLAYVAALPLIVRHQLP